MKRPGHRKNLYVDKEITRIMMGTVLGRVTENQELSQGPGVGRCLQPGGRWAVWSDDTRFTAGACRVPERSFNSFHSEVENRDLGTNN